MTEYLALGHADFTGTTDPLIEIGNEGATSTFHLLAGSGSTAPYILGIGVDHDNSPTGLVASVKGNASVGIGVSLESTSGPASVGFLGQGFAAGTVMKLVQGSNATGPLLDLRNDYGGAGNLAQWGTGAGDIKGYIGSAGDLVAQYGTAEDRNLIRLAPSAGGANQVFYQYTGTPGLWFASAISTSANGLLFQSGNAPAAIGSETVSTLLQLRNGNQIGFYGATPIEQQARPATLAEVIAVLAALGLTA